MQFCKTFRQTQWNFKLRAFVVSFRRSNQVIKRILRRNELYFLPVPTIFLRKSDPSNLPLEFCNTFGNSWFFAKLNSHISCNCKNVQILLFVTFLYKINEFIAAMVNSDFNVLRSNNLIRMIDLFRFLRINHLHSSLTTEVFIKVN